MVLSEPYSGSLYWWFSELAGHGRETGHPYYDAIYKNAEASIDVALTSLIVYDEIVLPFVDNVIPGRGGLKDLRFEELGISLAQEPVYRAGRITDRWVDELQAEAAVQQLLLSRGFSPDQAYTEINYAIADVLISQEADGVVVSSPGRQALAKQVVSLGVLDGEIDVGNRRASDETVDAQAGNAIAEYVNLIGLTLRRGDYDAIANLKRDPVVARYSEAFRRRLSPQDPGRSPAFVDALADVLAREASQKTLHGFFRHTGRALSLAGLIPGVGTVTGVAALVGEAAETTLNGLHYMLWHELGLAIKSHEFKEAMRHRVQEDQRASTETLLDELGFQ